MYVKYPKTPHFPWSENVSNNDKIIKTLDLFKNQEVVVTEKMDGENTTMYNDHIHARSINSTRHVSRDWVKHLWSNYVAYHLPDAFRICGENMYAKHSIHYTNLPSFFLGFSVWDNETCLSWDKTLHWFNYVGIDPVPILWRGTYNKKTIKKLWENINNEYHEGYVVRLTREIHINEFRTTVAKFVRKGHIQTNEHWLTSTMIKNEVN